MPDLYLFLAGALVTTIVAAAVTLLMWGAANEPRPGQPFESDEATSGGPRPRIGARSLRPELQGGLDARSMRSLGDDIGRSRPRYRAARTTRAGVGRRRF